LSLHIAVQKPVPAWGWFLFLSSVFSTEVWLGSCAYLIVVLRQSETTPLSSTLLDAVKHVSNPIKPDTFCQGSSLRQSVGVLDSRSLHRLLALPSGPPQTHPDHKPAGTQFLGGAAPNQGHPAVLHRKELYQALGSGSCRLLSPPVVVIANLLCLFCFPLAIRLLFEYNMDN
jgi:hypothetical protein